MADNGKIIHIILPLSTVAGFNGKIMWMEEILHKLIDGKHPMIDRKRVSHIQGGVGFLASVSENHQLT